MLMPKRKQVYVCQEFEKTVRKMFPYSSMYKITKQLNSQLEELLYGFKKDKKKR